MIEITSLATSEAEAFQTGSEIAPYLARAARRAPRAIEILNTDGAAALHAWSLDQARAAAGLETIDEVMTALRQAKLANHIAVAALDLAQRAALIEITGHLTEFADVAVESALQAALKARGLSGDGIFLIALGKMGAFELNYSSDIDMAAF